MKRTVSLIIVFCIMMSVVPVFAKAYTSGDYEYEKIADGLKITNYSGDDEIVKIPEEIDGEKVVWIGMRAFWRNEKIKAVIFPESVRVIDNEAFMDCGSLEEVYIYNDNAEIRNYRYEYTFHPVTTYYMHAFHNTNLKRIYGNKGASFEDDYRFITFDNKKYLYLGDYFTQDVVKIEARTDGEVVNVIEDKWVIDKVLEYVTNTMGTPYSEEEAREAEKLDWNVKITLYEKNEYPGPNYIKVIEKTSLGNFRLRIRMYDPDMVLKEEAYYSTSNYYLDEFLREAVMKSANLTGQWKNISWNLSKEGTLTLSGTGSAADIPSDKRWVSEWVKEIIVGEGITDISFGNYPNLTNIRLPESLERVTAIWRCPKLERVVVPENVREIETMAFMDCDSLKEVVITSKVPLRIERSALYVGKGARVYLPETVYWIDGLAFSYTWGVMGGYGVGGKVEDLTIITPYGCPAYTWALENGIRVETPIEISVNSTVLKGDDIFIDGDITYVSVKELFEAYGMQSYIDAAKCVAVCGNADTWMMFTLDNNLVKTNRGIEYMANKAIWVNDRFMVPYDDVIKIINKKQG